jgi:hypothetical protein
MNERSNPLNPPPPPPYSTLVRFCLSLYLSSFFSTTWAYAAGAAFIASSADAFAPAFHQTPRLLRSNVVPAVRANSGLKLSMNVSASPLLSFSLNPPRIRAPFLHPPLPRSLQLTSRAICRRLLFSRVKIPGLARATSRPLCECLCPLSPILNYITRFSAGRSSSPCQMRRLISPLKTSNSSRRLNSAC